MSSHILRNSVANVLDVLNRYPLRDRQTEGNKIAGENATNPQPDRSTIQVMMYIFPRQFGLHNVFADDVDPRQTVQPFKDYTLREDEITSKYPSTEKPKIPKRLRGKAVQLVQKLQILHSRCPYKELLEHYCPVGLFFCFKTTIADFAGF